MPLGVVATEMQYAAWTICLLELWHELFIKDFHFTPVALWALYHQLGEQDSREGLSLIYSEMGSERLSGLCKGPF